jgi:hypothetical protein
MELLSSDIKINITFLLRVDLYTCGITTYIAKAKRLLTEFTVLHCYVKSPP